MTDYYQYFEPGEVFTFRGDEACQLDGRWYRTPHPAGEIHTVDTEPLLRYRRPKAVTAVPKDWRVLQLDETVRFGDRYAIRPIYVDVGRWYAVSLEVERTVAEELKDFPDIVYIRRIDGRLDLDGFKIAVSGALSATTMQEVLQQLRDVVKSAALV